MSKNLIYCPFCKKDNVDQVLGEIIGEGTISIEHTRRKFGNPEATLVIGSEFILVCGYCRNIAYIRKEVLDESRESTNNATNLRMWNYFCGTIVTA